MNKNKTYGVMPLALDFEFFEDMIYTPDHTTEGFAELLRVTLMPWLYFRVQKENIEII